MFGQKSNYLIEKLINFGREPPDIRAFLHQMRRNEKWPNAVPTPGHSLNSGGFA